MTPKWLLGARLGRAAVLFCLLALALLVRARPAHAQTDAILPVINPLLLTGGTLVESQSDAARTRPALPALNPTVGPLIKHTYPDLIDRRTTAFLPEFEPALLAALTPISMPVTSQHWVRVDLSEQIAVAYSGQTPVRGFIIASGLPKTPTVTGTFHIRAKVRSQLMEGGSPAQNNYYYLPDVQWVQYFYKDYGFHGTYWHYAFGAPRSHGCINMTNADAKWLWDFLNPVWDGHTQWQTASDENPGALVIVHQ